MARRELTSGARRAARGLVLLAVAAFPGARPAAAQGLPGLYGNAGEAPAPVAAQGAASVRLQLRPAAEATADDVFLGDVAECEGPATACAAVSALPLGKAPAPGASVRFGAEALRQRVAADAPGVTFVVEGAPEAVVGTRAAYLDEDALARRMEALTDAFNAKQDQVEIKVAQVQLVRKVALRPGDDRVRFKDLEERLDTAQELDLRWFRNLARVPFTVGPAGDEGEGEGVTGEARVRFAVRVKAPVARAMVAAGTVVREEHLTWAWRNAEELNPSFALDPKDIVGRVARVAIRGGETPRLAQLVKEQVVKMGEDVGVIIRNGGLEVRGRAKAMAAGGVGDRIALQGIGGKKSLAGVVVGPGLLEVNLGAE